MSTSARKSRDRAAALRREAQARAQRRRRWIVILVVGVVVALIVGGAALLASRDTTGQGGGVAATAPTGADGYGVVVGEADASKVVIYEDFQCPVCGAFEHASASQVAQGIDDGKVRVEYRIVAFLDQASQNEYSSRAANAAAAVLDVAGPDAFKKFHDTLYANQPAENTAGPDNDQLIAWAVQAGADRRPVTEAINSGKFDQWVVDATDQMSKDGVTGTPTIEIDGEKLDPQTGLQRVLALVR
ncbi:MAG: DsbA family protein [Nocardioides sp.]